jgi:hypothetical protein
MAKSNQIALDTPDHGSSEDREGQFAFTRAGEPNRCPDKCPY